MSDKPVQPRKAYHHGHLAKAAVDQGLHILDAGQELSMRAIARTLGVTQRALFNHFADRSAFEAALCAQGFSRLATALNAASSQAEFLRIYVDFALAQSDLYDLMMRQSYRVFNGHAELRESADRVIAVSLHILVPEEANAEMRRRAVMRLWMIAHGGVGLHRSGVLLPRSDKAFVEELLRIANLAADQPEDEQSLWPDIEEEQT